jgi:ABC-2 type transport system permease protein
MSSTVRMHWRTFKWAAWLGWEMDSNWTEPALFIVFSVITPVAGAFILVLMYIVFASIGQYRDPAMFSYIYVGNAFFIFVGTTLFGTFQVIQADREWYQTIRYTYISPISYYTYIVGRAASKVAVGGLAVLITLVFGVFALDVQFQMPLDHIPMFFAALALGLFCLISIGICLAGVSFMTAKHTHGLAEGIPGLFYVFCGVLFPLSVLPDWGQAVGRAIPLTYWFDITRRLISPSLDIDTTLQGYDDLGILMLLLVSSLAFFVLSILIFKVGEYFARKAGKIDMTTSY